MTGIELIAEERRRQIEKEGWTVEHDIFEHQNGQLVDAAVSYALTKEERKILSQMVAADGNPSDIPPTWPFEKEWWKPTPDDRIRELVKAGALIAAEIDRLEESRWICPKCLKPIGDCEVDEWGYYYCPHCDYKGIRSEFHTDCAWHPVHKAKGK